ncbi:growth hormone secretagogue receptor type 1-like [Haliotis asinina]|uniref:growth hormone secretagogue receptor type 1-like n=1 Tax=Haliotis asinina TaxID=109174 RepID=UPI0035323C8B
MGENTSFWTSEFPNTTDAPAKNHPSVPHPPAYLLGTATALYVVVFVVGLCGNFAVISVVLQCRSMRTFINFLFLNLCLADLFVLLITGPTAVVDIYAREVWYLGKSMCHFITFLENVVSHASVSTILAISIERFRVACRTQTQLSTRTSVIVKTFICVWTVSITSAIPFFFITEYKTLPLVDGTLVPVCRTPIHKTWHRVYIVLITSFFFVIPLLFILTLYSKVGTKLISLYRIERQKLETYPKEIVKLKRQMIQIIVTVVLVFFICHTPYRALVIWTMFEDRGTLRNLGLEGYLAVLYFPRILLYSNHAINPFVYNFVSRKFRRALLWVCCDRRRNGSRMDKREQAELHQRRGSRFQNGSARFGSVLKEEIEYIVHTNRSQRNDFLVLYENLLN